MILSPWERIRRRIKYSCDVNVFSPLRYICVYTIDCDWYLNYCRTFSWLLGLKWYGTSSVFHMVVFNSSPPPHSSSLMNVLQPPSTHTFVLYIVILHIASYQNAHCTSLSSTYRFFCCPSFDCVLLNSIECFVLILILAAYIVTLTFLLSTYFYLTCEIYIEN